MHAGEVYALMGKYRDVRDTLAASAQAGVTAMGITDVNVYSTLNKSAVAPAIVVRPGNPTILYGEADGRSPLARWNFEVLIIVGQVNEQAAQDRIADMIDPDSPIIEALDDSDFGNGFAQTRRALVGETPIGATLYASALIGVQVLS